MSQLYPFTDPILAKSQAPLQIVSGDGCRVRDSEGREYLDAVAGLWCASLGFSNERLIAAANRQYTALPYYHSFMGRTTDVTETLAARLVEKLPGELSHVFFACSGSEAVDSAVKLSRLYQNARGKPNKKAIIARESAYHGSGIVSGSLTGMSYCHDGFDMPERGVLRTGRPHYRADALPGESESAFSQRRADELEQLILHNGPDTISAFIAEPVIGSGGVIPPPSGYWQAIQAVLKRHDVLLVADEIITGFGRTGQWFGAQSYAMEPDLMTMAKQLTGAYFPMSALAVSKEVNDTISRHAHELGTFGHGFTYGGHPVGAAIALEALTIYEEMDLPAHVQQLSAHLQERLLPVEKLSEVVELRLVGLMAGIELQPYGDDGEFCRAVGAEAQRRGVLFRVIGNTLAISPPLNVTSEEIDTCVQVLRESIAATSQQYNP